MMATISPWSTMTRQPFGLMDGERLRNLSSEKNTQNGKTRLLQPFLFSLLTCEIAIFTPPTTNLKRRYEAPSLDEVKLENVDPSILASPTKKHKVGLQETTTTNIVKSLLARQIRSPRRSDVKSTRSQGIILGQAPTTPVNSTPSPTNIVSAPAVAGRSPQSKRVGILSRRRMSASPFMRVNPPFFPSNGVNDDLPLSIDAALSGTVPAPKPTTRSFKRAKPEDFCTLEESKPKGWMFDIYEESEMMQLENVVCHQACNLDISDDEGAAKAKADKGKENIPPSDLLSAEVSTGMSALRNDEPRTPLAELEASKFYAEGCDASSYFLVPEDESADNEADKLNVDPAKVEVVSAPAVEIWESESATYGGVSYGLDEEEL